MRHEWRIGRECSTSSAWITFEGSHEVLEGGLIVPARIQVVVVQILSDRFLDDLDGALRRFEDWELGT